MRKSLYLSLLAISVLFMTSCDECRKVECENDGTCVEGTCECPEGFSGASCQTEDLCITQEVTCLNDGECINGECDCKPTYYGETCEIQCLYGTYENGNCDCNQGIEGAECDVFSRDKFLGVYTYKATSGVESCVISMGEYENGDVWKVEISNISTFNDTDGYAEISGSSISFPDQEVTGSGNIKYTIKTTSAGTFEDDGEEITFTISITRKSSIEGSTEETDTYKFSRQSF